MLPKVKIMINENFSYFLVRIPTELFQKKQWLPIFCMKICHGRKYRKSVELWVPQVVHSLFTCRCTLIKKGNFHDCCMQKLRT